VVTSLEMFKISW